jgi:crossover junction endodeoxyribonuclease RuvC
MGIDPGGSGGLAWLTTEGIVGAVPMPGSDHDLLEALRQARAWWPHGSFAMLERVGAMPKQGLSSTFKFGVSFGSVRCALAATRIPYELVTPAKWQAAMGIPPKRGEGRTAHKNRLKARAQQLFPDVTMTHAVADALLLAEYAKRFYSQNSHNKNETLP